MSLIEDLLERPFDQAITSRYTAMNGLIYLGAGTSVLIWPGMVQTIFRDAPFVGNEAALLRVMGMAVMVIGWLYLFGGLSGGRRIVAASVLDRVVLVPLVLVPLAIAGVFPHFLLAFAVLDPTLGIGAWLLLRSNRPGVHSTAGRHSCSSRNREIQRRHYCGQEIKYDQCDFAIVPLTAVITRELSDPEHPRHEPGHQHTDRQAADQSGRFHRPVRAGDHA